MPYLIRAEGVNLYSVLEDTSDLSTIRGGGLMLLKAASDIEGETKSCRKISSGASAILLSVGNKNQAIDAVNKIRIFLKNGENAHFTFVVNTVEEKKGQFNLAETAVLAANRWQQMQSPSLAIPAIPKNPDTDKPVCDLDQVRPSADTLYLSDNVAVPVSLSVKIRRDQGRALRQGFYRKEIENLKKASKNLPHNISFVDDLNFTDDLHSLAGEYPDAGNLEDKFAILYLDGNKFGTFARGCTNGNLLEQWDKKIKKLRRTLLLEILRLADQDPRWHALDKRKPGKKLARLETLLWGGDEMMFAVPAWLGWSLLDFIFKHTSQWQHDGKKLTHGVGLVFCNVKAPINRITKLAKQLADKAKEVADRKENAVCWLALESFDHVGTDFDRYMSRRYHGTISARNWVLTANQITVINKNLNLLKSILPLSQIVQAAISAVHLQAASHHEEESLKKILKNAYTQLPASAEMEKKGSELLDLWNHLKGTHSSPEPSFPEEFPDELSCPGKPLEHVTAWVQLAELWDYAGWEPLDITNTR